MRWRCAALTLVILATGCFTPAMATRGMMDRLRAVGGPQGPDVVIMDVAVIEVPAADVYVDHDLWSAVDEQAFALDRKAALDDNGFRVGVIGGLLPGKLEALIRTERSCPDPRRVTQRSGQPKLINIGSQVEECTFDFKADGSSRTLKFAAAQCGFTVIPTRTADGLVKLAFTPQMQHGGRTLFVQPAEGDGWSIAGQRPTERFLPLSFEITLKSQDYVIIGSHFERDKSLGRTTFVESGDKPVQRLLVIRARPQGENPLPELTLTGTSTRQTPLALQAIRTTRGSSH